MKRLLDRGVVPGLAGLLLGLVVLASAPADTAVEPVEKKKANLDRKIPENVGDLKAIQDQVKATLKRVMPATVGILLGPGAGSGVIVSEDGYVLTAGHVSGRPGQTCTVVFPDGKTVKGKTLGYNKRMDSGLIKIIDKPENGKWPFAQRGDSAKLGSGQWVLAVGHPGGYRKGRTPVVRLGRVLEMSGSIIRTDCALVGGDSGGPLFDLDGKVVGIHSRISFNLTQNIHVPVNAYKDDWDRLAKGDEWGGLFDSGRPANAAYMGVALDSDSDSLKVQEVTDNSPAEKAGLKKGDVIVRIDGTKLGARKELTDYLGKKKINDEVVVEVLRDSKPLKFTFKLGKRP
jgi:serine protease Do